MTWESERLANQKDETARYKLCAIFYKTACAPVVLPPSAFQPQSCVCCFPHVLQLNSTPPSGYPTCTVSDQVFTTL